MICQMMGFIVTNESPHKCYVCGEDQARLPFIEEHKNNNSSIIDKIPKSCDEFEADNNIFEFQCPRGFTGCVTKLIGAINIHLDKKIKYSVIKYFLGSSVVRTCIDVSIEDCRIANNEYICICTESLCNKQNIPEGIIDIDADNDDDDDDDSDEESGDTMSIQSKTTNWPTTLSGSTVNATIEKFNVSTIAPSINMSVSFNLSYILAFIFAFKLFL